MWYNDTKLRWKCCFSHIQPPRLWSRCNWHFVKSAQEPFHNALQFSPTPIIEAVTQWFNSNARLARSELAGVTTMRGQCVWLRHCSHRASYARKWPLQDKRRLMAKNYVCKTWMQVSDICIWYIYFINYVYVFFGLLWNTNIYLICDTSLSPSI